MTESKPSIFIRKQTVEDCSELLFLIRKSKELHQPWVFLPLTEDECQNYLNRCQNNNFAGFFICHSNTNKILGVVNLSQIFYGNLQSAYLSYYADVDFAGRGFMSQGLHCVINYAFQTLALHRLEANIQPKNKQSINLVTRLGFRKEGFSEKYLKINGEWRDHQRWALTVENWRSIKSSES